MCHAYIIDEVDQAVFVAVVSIAVFSKQAQKRAKKVRYFLDTYEEIGIFGLHTHTPTQIDIEAKYSFSLCKHEAAVMPIYIAGVGE